ncbi:MAG: hypothetical protein WCX79_00895 [Candidatus Paceibacterota bacterium]|jgi:hypothetical protein
MKVYLVGTKDCEETNTRYICIFKNTALKLWEELRQELIERANNILEKYSNDKTELRNLENLSEIDPEKMDNYPQEEPFIQEMETED